jgi:transposase
MLRMEEWVDIVAAHHRGVSIKEIARQTGISRNTVRNAIRAEHAPKYERAPIPGKLDPYKEYLIARLTEFPRLSVEKLFVEISAQGYSGGKTILADFTRPYRQARHRNSDIRFETPPGKQAQVDWAELGIHEVGGRRMRLSLFLMVLGYSRMMYAELVTDETQATFLACHEHAFAFFGGMTEEILYDNAKVVALQHNREGVVFNPALLDFAGRCGFKPKACHPYRPQTKGKVERSVRYIRDSFLEGERFAGLEDMADRLAAWLDNVANIRVHATTRQRPIDMLFEEKLNDYRPGFKPGAKPQPRILRLAGRDFSFVDSPKVENCPLSAYEAAVV